MDADELAEYKRRRELRERRKADVRWAAGFTDTPARAMRHPKSHTHVGENLPKDMIFLSPDGRQKGTK